MQKITFQIGLRKSFKLKNLKLLCFGHILLTILAEKNCWNFLWKIIEKKKVKHSLELKKRKKKIGDELYVKEKGYNNSFNNWTDKKIIVLLSEYFPKPKSLEADVKVELDLFNYATKGDLKIATGVDYHLLLRRLI